MVFVLWLWTVESGAPRRYVAIMYPLASFLAVFIIKSFLEAINYHDIRPLDLTIGPWVRNRDIFNLDARIFTQLLELVGREV
jgi:hypothetical protein